MSRFRVVKRAPDVRTQWKKSLASEFARLRAAGKSDSDALRILFDMVTTNGPVPELERSEGNRAS